MADPAVAPAVSMQDCVGPKFTVPVGVITVPGESSVTLALQVVDCPITMVEGEHKTAMPVVLRLTVTNAAIAVLAAL